MTWNPFKKGQGFSGPGTIHRHHRIRITVIAVSALLVLVGGFFLWRAGSVMDRISMGNGNIFSNVMKSLPGVQSKLEGEDDGRINILLLGMRGEHVEGGGLLADTIMVLSVHPSSGEEGDAPKASIVSIPRDLYVTVPGTSDKQKINAVHHYGEQQGQGKGMEAMKQAVSEVTGQPIQYAATINFKGFEDLVDAIGGVTVSLDTPFMESLQFHEPHVCDSVIFTDPMLDERGRQMYECKYSTKPRSSMPYAVADGNTYPFCVNKPEATVGIYKIMAQYPMCYNTNEECGGVFDLGVGDNHLDGETALCYARARYGSNDFERAKRQQEVIKLIKEKALSLGTLSDFSKVNALFDSLGDNARTDMEGWEMKRFFDLYQSLGDATIAQKVLDTTEEGLLYHPETETAAGYILLPVGDTYDRIHELFRGIL